MMKWLNYILAFALLMFSGVNSFGQTEATGMYASGKWPVVLAVAAIIIVGLTVYIILLRRKHGKLKQREAAIQTKKA